MRKTSLWSVGFIFAEALLGAGLVLFQYVAHDASVGRAFYLAAHLLNTLFLLGAIALTGWFAEQGTTRLQWKSVPWYFWSAIPLAMLVSVTGTVAALGDTLFPSTSFAAGWKQDFSGAASFLLRLRVLHPFVAVTSGVLFSTVAALALRMTTRPQLRPWAAAVLGATFVQIFAGVLNLSLLAPVWMQIVHLLLADAVWIALVLFVAEAAVPERI